jgi:hypothetical protein
MRCYRDGDLVGDFDDGDLVGFFDGSAERVKVGARVDGDKEGEIVFVGTVVERASLVNEADGETVGVLVGFADLEGREVVTG